MPTTQAERETIAKLVSEFKLFLTPDPFGILEPLPAHLVPESIHGTFYAIIQADNGEYMKIVAWDDLALKIGQADLYTLPKELRFRVTEACKVPDGTDLAKVYEELQKATPL